MARALFRKQGRTLTPIDDDGCEFIDAIKDGKQVMVSAHVPRNPVHHRKLFLLLKKIIDGGAWDGDTDTLLTWLKIATHHVDTIIGPDGQTYYVPKSIDFASLDQAAFARFYDRAVFVISTRLLGSEDWRALRKEIDDILDRDLRRRLTGTDPAAIERQAA